MNTEGAVAATKSLRDRTLLLDERINLAYNILNDEVNAVIPRKEIVIFEWLLDMLTIDYSAKFNLNIWKAILYIWPVTPVEGRERAIKNHKYISVVIDTLSPSNSSAELVDLVVKCTKLMSETCKNVFNFASDAQPAQLILAYCSCKPALENNELGQLIYNSLRNLVKIFGKPKNPVQVLDLLLLEPDMDRRLYYLKDFLTSSENPVVPSKEFHIESILLAMCESGVMLPSRIKDLATAFPGCINQILNIAYTKKPTSISSELLKFLLDEAFKHNIDWHLVDQCLLFNPAVILDTENKFLQEMMDKQNSIPAQTLANVLLRLADLRLLPDFLIHWEPLLPLDPAVHSALMRSLESISATQLVDILNAKPKSLSLVLSSISYQTAANSLVENALAKLFAADDTCESMKADILNIQLNTHVKKLNKKDNTFVLLRSIEVGDAKDPESLVSSAAKRFDTDSETNSFILLRYFPLLETYLGEHRLKKIIKRASYDVRLKLANCAAFLEHPKITTALIETAISKHEVEILAPIPKQVYDWDLRHKATDILLKYGTSNYEFTYVGKLVHRLLDPQNPPNPAEIALLLRLSSPKDSELFMDIAQSLKKDSSYLEKLMEQELCEWQKCCVQCILAIKNQDRQKESIGKVRKWIEHNYKKLEFVEPVLCMLNLMPEFRETKELTKVLSIEITASVNGESIFPRKLFHLICQQQYHWKIISAFYVYTRCRFEEEFIDYLKGIQPQNIKEILYTASSEKQYGVIKALVSAKMISEERHVITAIVANAFTSNDLTFWELCDVILREDPALLTQFTLESLLELVSNNNDNQSWEIRCLICSRILLFKRNFLRKRLHLMISSMTSLLVTIKSPNQSLLFLRLVDNLCNPQQLNSRNRGVHKDLTSQVSKERRHVSKYAGVLLQNIIVTIINSTSTARNWTDSNEHLRNASLLLIDLTYGDGLKSVSAGMDNTTRTYLRSLFDEYKLHGKWSTDD